jgi:hypothetical protein
MRSPSFFGGGGYSYAAGVPLTAAAAAFPPSSGSSSSILSVVAARPRPPPGGPPSSAPHLSMVQTVAADFRGVVRTGKLVGDALGPPLTNVGRCAAAIDNAMFKEHPTWRYPVGLASGLFVASCLSSSARGVPK